MTQWPCPLYSLSNTDIKLTHFVSSRYSRDEIGGPRPSFPRMFGCATCTLPVARPRRRRYASSRQCGLASAPALVVAVALAAVTLALFVARHPRRRRPCHPHPLLHPRRRRSPATLVTVAIAPSSLTIFVAALIIRRALSLFVVACRPAHVHRPTLPLPSLVDCCLFSCHRCRRPALPRCRCQCPALPSCAATALRCHAAAANALRCRAALPPPCAATLPLPTPCAVELRCRRPAKTPLPLPRPALPSCAAAKTPLRSATALPLPTKILLAGKPNHDEKIAGKLSRGVIANTCVNCSGCRTHLPVVLTNFSGRECQ